MRTNNLIEKLVATDSPDKWADMTRHLAPIEKRMVFDEAEPLWIKRMWLDGKLLIHPNVAEQLSSMNWKPNDLQKKMIWASVLASFNSSDSQKRFHDIKQSIIKKHGNSWWFDVYKRLKPAYAARAQIEKTFGPALEHAASISKVLGAASYETRMYILQRIPKV